ncbi:hypothetical protein T01_13370 [Trichinella spiralis]|uniref:Uncharacterized protein n=1 Tax=Trichinella spiralis TaxID=6334 RepID=A0A0V1AQR7_TRISP|nr:hypothetical protein T01_13370 [Trichinella spiralis]
MLQEFCLQIVRTCRSTRIEMPISPKFYERAQKNDSVEMVGAGGVCSLRRITEGVELHFSHLSHTVRMPKPAKLDLG